MTLTEAFDNLLANWQQLPAEYREKYKSYKSKYENQDKKTKEVKQKSMVYVGQSKMREMLIKAGYLETWKKLKKISKNNS